MTRLTLPLDTPLRDHGGQCYNVLSYGAKGDGATDDTAAINAVLSSKGATGGVVLLPAGRNFLISAPLILPSNTVLDARGATVTLAAGSNCNLLNNKGVTANRSVADAAITTGTSTLTSATAGFTAADVGASVIIPGAGISGQLLVTTISSVTNGTTAVLAANAGTTVSAAALSLYYRDSNILLLGGTWARGANAGANNALHSLFFRHIDHLTLRDVQVTSTAGKYAIAIGDATSYTVENPNFNTHSDGVHITGPASGGFIANVTGTTGDDMVAFTPADFSTYADTAGDIVQTEVRGIYANGSLTCCDIVGGTGCKIVALTVRGCHGTTQLSCVRFQDLTTPAGALDCRDVIVEDVDAVPSSSAYWLVELAGTAMESVTLRDLYWSANYTGAQVVNLRGTGSAIKSLTIDGLTVTAGTFPSGMVTLGATGACQMIRLSRVRVTSTAVTGCIVFVNSSFTLGNVLSVEGVQAMRSSNGDPVIYLSGGTIPKMQLDNIYLNGGGRLLRTNSGSGACEVAVSNAQLDGAWDIAQIGSNVDFTIHSASVVTSQTVLFNLTAGALSVRGFALLNSGAKATAAPAAGTLRLVHPQMRMDVSNAFMTKTDGDQCYNTNAALACGAGTVLSNGANWKNLYSGSTY